MGDLVSDNAVVNYDAMRQATGVPFSVNEYLILRTAANFAVAKYGNKANSNGKNRPLNEGIYNKKGSSKIFRYYLDSNKTEKPARDLRTTRTFFNLVGCDLPDPETCEELNCVWNHHFLPTNVRTFCFQFVNNSLATGPRLAGRYRANPAVIVDERCVFCVKSAAGVAEREDFVHLFFSCPAVARCINMYLIKYGDAGWTDVERKFFIFSGSASGIYTMESPITILGNFILFFMIWKCKLSRKVPMFTTLEFDMLTIFDVALSISTKLRNVALTGQSPICRRWRERSGRG